MGKKIDRRRSNFDAIGAIKASLDARCIDGQRHVFEIWCNRRLHTEKAQKRRITGRR